MQSPKRQDIDQLRQATSCEIIQEMHGLGAYYLMRQTEDELFDQLMFKYGQHSCDAPEVAQANRDILAALIRKTLSQRKAELTMGSSDVMPRKKAVLSAAAASAGIAGRAAGDSSLANDRNRRS